jgi:hypothetical protein
VVALVVTGISYVVAVTRPPTARKSEMFVVVMERVVR